MFARPAGVGQPGTDGGVSAIPEHDVTETATAKRPPKWSMRHWPVRWKVVAIALVPLVLAMAFGGLRIYSAISEAGHLRLAADRAEVVPATTKYMSALDVALMANSTGADVVGARKNYDARKYELQSRLAGTDADADVRAGVSTLLDGGQALVDKVASNSIGLRDRVAAYAPILLTAENVINGSVRVDSEKIRAQAEGLSRAVGAAGQMLMQRLLVTRGADLPEPDLRNAMITLAGTEPSTLFGMSEILGVGSPDAKALQQEMVTRMTIISDPGSVLVNNPVLLRSIQIDRSDRRPGHQPHHRVGDHVGGGPRLQSTRRRHPRHGPHRGGHRGRTGRRVPGGAVTGPAVAGAARQRPESRPRRPRAGDRPGACRR